MRGPQLLPFQPENHDGSQKGRGEELLAKPGVFLA